MLSDPAIVPDKDVEDYILRRGKGWVCEIENRVLGFSIISVVDHNVWALFVHPDFEKLGIGKQLHDLMMDWYFSKTHDPVWLGTAPGTRAESFYHKAGWTANGLHGSKEVKFEMTEDQWKNRI
jgi:GNAT superfamily N-acetyltransferase